MQLLFAIVLLGLAFILIAIKILLKKDGEFAGTCASNNPMFQNDEGTCGFCGAKPDEQCKGESK